MCALKPALGYEQAIIISNATRCAVICLLNGLTFGVMAPGGQRCG